jgi:glycosyltransferase involved in cell wall biosynthesis
MAPFPLRRRAFTARSFAGRRDGLASFPGVLPTNPYQRLLYEHLEPLGIRVVEGARFKAAWMWRARREVAVLHFHWPQSYWRHGRGPARLRGPLSYVKLGLLAARLTAARALGYRVAWTIHQVFPHEVVNRRLDRLGARVLARLSHVLIAHDESTRRSAVDELGAFAARAEIVPHGSYIGVYPPGLPRTEARAELGVDDGEVVLLCFGHLRAYKDVDFLLEAFGAAAAGDAVLVIAGPVGDDGVAEKVRAAAAADPRIRPVLGFVPDEAVAQLFEASDVAVVARNDGGTSASIILGLSLGRPVIAARRSTYEGLLGGERAGWLFDPGDAAGLGAAIEAAVAGGEEARREKGAAARQRAEQLAWPDIAARTAALLRN